VFVDPQRDTSGDYGYDLAHEAAGREGRPVAPDGGEERPPVAAGGRAEPDGDYGYDEAHDFRPG
jgi:hypothetical protein